MIEDKIRPLSLASFHASNFVTLFPFLSVADGTIHGLVAAVRDDSRREYRGANWPAVGQTA